MPPEQYVSWICLFGEAILNNDSLICHALLFEDFELNIATGQGTVLAECTECPKKTPHIFKKVITPSKMALGDF